jgi:hypothetical protein
MADDANMDDIAKRSESEKRRRGNPDVQKPEDDITLVPASSDWQNMNLRVENLDVDLQRERAKRRDIEDDLEKQERKIGEVVNAHHYFKKGLKSVMFILASEGEHKDSLRVLVIKKTRDDYEGILPVVRTIPDDHVRKPSLQAS